MPLAKTEIGKDIPNKAESNISQREDAIRCIKHIKYADLWLRPKTIVKGELVRIDIQDPVEKYQNIQIQINDKRGKSTISGILLEKEFLGNEEDRSLQSHILRRVRHALTQSLETGKMHSVVPKTEKEIAQEIEQGKINKLSNIYKKTNRGIDK
jgi:hypothetical protein